MGKNRRGVATELTGSHCSMAADAIEAVFLKHHPLRKLEGTPLAAGLGRLRELSQISGSLLGNDPNLQIEGPERALLAAGVARSMRIALTLTRASDVSGMATQLNHIRNLNPLQPIAGEGKAWDLLLEVEVAAMALAINAELRFDEPDVLLRRRNGAEFALACKRPEKQSSILNAISDALRQCLASGRESIAIIAVDRMTQPGMILHGQISAQHEYRKLIDKCCGPEIERSRQTLRDLGAPAESGKPVHGIMFVGFPYAARADPGGTTGWLLLSPFCSRLVSNPGVPSSFHTLKGFQRALEAGDALLRSAPLTSAT